MTRPPKKRKKWTGVVGGGAKNFSKNTLELWGEGVYVPRVSRGALSGSECSVLLLGGRK